MKSFHHKQIKRFSLNGVIHNDSLIARLKGEYKRLLVLEMKLSGYVQRLDIDTDFTIVYNEKAETFEFELSIYGIYTGKKQAEWIQGVDGTMVIPIPQNRSNESLQEQV